MAKYIECFAYSVYLESRTTKCLDEYGKGWNNGINAARIAALTLPGNDVAPVVHGRWIPLPSMAPEYACSVCERDYTWGELEEASYCPNCGAKMDGGGII